MNTWGRQVVFQANGVVVQYGRKTADAILGSHEVVVRNLYSLISPGTELACLSGSEPWFRLPNVPGYAAVGRVCDCGSRVQGVNPGEVVFTYGPHSEFFKLDVSNRYTGVCVRLPTNVEPVHALFARIIAIVLASLSRVGIANTGTAAVIGLGLLGNVMAQTLKLHGWNVVGYTGTTGRRAIAERCGIPTSFCAGAQAPRSGGAKLLVDATGQAARVVDALGDVEEGGEVLLLGTPRGSYISDIVRLLEPIYSRNLKLTGGSEWQVPFGFGEAQEGSTLSNVAHAFGWIASESINIRPLVTHVVGPKDAVDVYSGLSVKRSNYLGVVFDWNL